MELMRARFRAHYRFDERGRMVALNQWDGGEAPRFYLGRSTGGAIWGFGASVSDELAVALGALAASAQESDAGPREPAQAAAYERLLAPVKRRWAGPAYRFPADVSHRSAAVPISADNADLLSGALADWLPDIPHRHPFMAAVEDGRAVAVCASVRISDTVHEAGVETLPRYRRRGHATDAVAGWAAAVRAMGAEPVYSTSWSNPASLAVARRLRLVPIGVDFNLV